jgi:phenylacetate-coenzyme A ligase PaaK-like adenylate-forming protein
VTIGNNDTVYPSFFDDEIYSTSEVVDYQVVISSKKDTDCIKFVVETTKEGIGIEQEIKERLLKNPVIGSNIDSGRLSLGEFELVSMGTLRSKSRAKKLITDNR